MELPETHRNNGVSILGNIRYWAYLMQLCKSEAHNADASKTYKVAVNIYSDWSAQDGNAAQFFLMVIGLRENDCHA